MRAHESPHRAAAVAAAKRRGVPVELFLRLVQQESGWNPSVVSKAGAIGLAQLMPDTARGLKVDPWDPEQNLDGGAKYLRAQYDRFGSWTLALAAYNAGPGNVERYGGVPPFAETQAYVRIVGGGGEPIPTGTAPTPTSLERPVSFAGAPPQTVPAPATSYVAAGPPNSAPVTAYEPPPPLGGGTPADYPPGGAPGVGLPGSQSYVIDTPQGLADTWRMIAFQPLSGPTSRSIHDLLSPDGGTPPI